MLISGRHEDKHAAGIAPARAGRRPRLCLGVAVVAQLAVDPLPRHVVDAERADRQQRRRPRVADLDPVLAAADRHFAGPSEHPLRRSVGAGGCEEGRPERGGGGRRRGPAERVEVGDALGREAVLAEDDAVDGVPGDRGAAGVPLSVNSIRTPSAVAPQRWTSAVRSGTSSKRRRRPACPRRACAVVGRHRRDQPDLGRPAACPGAPATAPASRRRSDATKSQPLLACGAVTPAAPLRGARGRRGRSRTPGGRR